MAAGARRRRRGRRRLPARARDHLRAGAPLLRRRGAAAAAPPAPARAAVRHLGGPQRLPRARAQPPGRDLRRDPRRHRRRRVRRPRGRGHRPHLVGDAVAPRRRTSSSRTSAPAASARTASRARPPSGRTPRWRSRSARWAAATRTDAPDPAAVLRMVERVMTEGDARTGAIGCDLGPEDARALLRAWLDAVDLRHERARPARPPPVRRLLARRPGAPRAPLPRAAPAARGGDRGRDPSKIAAAASELFTRLLRRDPLRARRGLPRAREAQARDARRTSRCGSRWSPTASAAMHGVTHTIDEIRERGVPGFEVEVIGTDPHVDRRLSAVAEVEIPFYAGLKIGVPSLPAVVEALAEGRYDVLHLCSPGPAGVAAAMIGRVMRPADRRLLPHRAGRLHGAALRRRRRSAAGVEVALGAFYGGCDVVLSPSRGVRRAAARARHRGRADRPLGPRRRRRPLLPRHCAPARPTAASACSTPAG